MAQQYSIFHPPVLAFFSRGFYDDVARRWKGVAFLYLFLLLALTWIVPIVLGYLSFTAYMASEADHILQQIPHLQIQDGRVSIDRPEPHRITDPDSGETFAIIDTTGQITSLDNEPGAAMLMTEDELIARQRNQTRIYDLSEVMAIDIDEAKVRGLIDRFTVPGFIVGYFVLLLFSFVYRIVQALIYGAIGLGFAAMMGKTLSYAGAVRLAIMAVTPVIVLDTILMQLLSGVGCMWWVACLVIGMAYLAFGVWSISNAQGPPALEPWMDDVEQPAGFN